VCFFSVAAIFAPKVNAGADDNISGYAWSENIGWVSFNNLSDGSGIDYGVNIDEVTGLLSGYAWSENIGWISFNGSDAVGCNGCSGADCQAKASLTVEADGSREVSGWAKVLANGGGWDGCVSLRGGSYGVSIDSAGDFHGWAWSDMVLGWMSFNSADSGAGGNAHKVYTTAKFAPIAKMECGGTSCAYGTCDNSPGASWIAYPPVQQCPICIFSVTDKSEGNAQCAYWELSGPASYGYLAAGAGQTINLGAFANNIVPGNYTLSLRVSDTSSADCSAGNTNTATRSIEIKQGVIANFKCALTDPNIYDEETGAIIGINDGVFQDCTSSLGKSEFGKKIVKGGVVWVKDISTPSGGASAIVDYDWRFTIDGNITTADGDIASFIAGKKNKIELDVFDNGARENCTEVSFTARSLPKWQEINPVGMIWQKIASLAQSVFAAN